MSDDPGTAPQSSHRANDAAADARAAEEPKIGQSAPAGAPITHSVAPPADPTHAASGGVQVGRVIDVDVTALRDREVEVKLADGRVGVIARNELSDGVVVGDRIPAALLAREDPKGRVVLSADWAAKQLAWERIDSAVRNDESISGVVERTIKGGFVVDVGVRAFLPSSLAGRSDGRAGSMVGRTVEALVVEAVREDDRVVLSVRELQNRRRRERERELLESLKPGQRAHGRVVSAADFGAVIDLGGLRGLIPRGELTWGRIDDPSEIVSVGQEVEVVVVDVNRSRKRVGLSLRLTRPDPLESIKVGDVLDATVTKVAEFGAFVRLDYSGADGLVHISELTEQQGIRPDQLVVPGESLLVKVIAVDRKKRRLDLSVTQTLTSD